MLKVTLCRQGTSFDGHFSFTLPTQLFSPSFPVRVEADIIINRRDCRHQNNIEACKKKKSCHRPHSMWHCSRLRSYPAGCEHNQIYKAIQHHQQKPSEKKATIIKMLSIHPKMEHYFSAEKIITGVANKTPDVQQKPSNTFQGTAFFAES